MDTRRSLQINLSSIGMDRPIATDHRMLVPALRDRSRHFSRNVIIPTCKHLFV